MGEVAVRPLTVVDSAVDLIGGTPMVRLSRFGARAGADSGDVFAKCEFLSPGGSVKDRLGLGMILAAEREGKLAPGGTIIEPTAGNTGIGLALVGVARGYRVILCVPEKYSIEKQKAMAALGGTVVRTPTEAGMKGAIEKAHALAREIPNAYVPQQEAAPPAPSSASRGISASGSPRSSAPSSSPRAPSSEAASPGLTRSRGSGTRSGRR